MDSEAEVVMDVKWFNLLGHLDICTYRLKDIYLTHLSYSSVFKQLSSIVYIRILAHRHGCFIIIYNAWQKSTPFRPINYLLNPLLASTMQESSSDVYFFRSFSFTGVPNNHSGLILPYPWLLVLRVLFNNQYKRVKCHTLVHIAT